MENLTDIQQKIVTEASNNPDLYPSEIAERVGCSISYAREIRSRYLDAIIGENDISDYAITPTLGFPMSIIMSEEVINELSLSNEDYVEIEIETEGQNATYVAPIKKKSDIKKEDIIHSLLYCIEKLSPSIPPKLESLGEPFLDENSEDNLSIHGRESLSDFLRLLSNYSEQKIESNEILVGTVFLRHDLDLEEEDSETFELPKITLRENFVREIYSDNMPRLLDIRSTEAEPLALESIYFRSQEGLSEELKSKMADELQTVRYIDLNLSGSIQLTPSTVGPLTVNTKDGFVDLSSTEIVFSEIRGYVASHDSLLFEKFHNVLRNSRMDLQFPDKDYNVNISVVADEENNSFIIYINSVDVTVLWTERFIGFIFPDNMNAVDVVVRAVINYLRDQFDDNIGDVEDVDFQYSPRVWRNKWVFDTNSLYHQIINGNPSSILKTFLPNVRLYDSKVIIPWTLIYEINKHKDEGPPKSVQEQGIENLKILNILSSNGFIDLNTEKIPENIQTKVSESHVADMHIMRTAQQEDAVLVSGDKRLRELSEVTEVSVVDIGELAVVEDVPDLRSEIWDDVQGDIGNAAKTEEEILSEIQSAQTEMISKNERLQNAKEINPKEYVSQWINEKRLITYLDIDNHMKMKYDKAVTNDVVVTPSAASKLCGQIIEYKNKNYLPNYVLDSLANDLNLHSPGLPYLNFHVPLSNVIGPQSMSMGGISPEGRDYYQLNDLRNADYTVEQISESTSDQQIRDSVQLAREQQYTILCTGTDRYIEIVGGLLGIHVLNLPDWS